MAFFFALLTLVHVYVMADGIEPQGLDEVVFQWSSIIWALPFVPATVSVVGFLMYRHPREEQLSPMTIRVSFRIVSRGFNIETLNETIASIRRCMQGNALFPYVIEVVTDSEAEVGPDAGYDLVHIVVPPDYETPNKSFYKARALEYALWHSTLPENGWIMHLDEESCITPSLVLGIRKAIEEEEQSGKHRIGQGAILYHNSLSKHPFLTLADSIRSGDDVGRFYFQHRLGITLFGLHGSFILTRNSVEKEVGFDFGADGSITEDAFWALAQMQAGRRCRWVDGYVVEQAPLNFSDFVKQRRRWFVGLIKCAALTPVRFRYRLALTFSVLLWAFSWASVSYTYSNLVVGTTTPVPIVVLANLVFASYISQYVIGLKLNLADRGGFSLPKKAALYVLQVVLIPVFSIMEGCGVAYALVKPETKFHVVKKAGAPA